jgi:hypothetical protein
VFPTRIEVGERRSLRCNDGVDGLDSHGTHAWVFAAIRHAVRGHIDHGPVLGWAAADTEIVYDSDEVIGIEHETAIGPVNSLVGVVRIHRVEHVTTQDIGNPAFLQYIGGLELRKCGCTETPHAPSASLSSCRHPS